MSFTESPLSGFIESLASSAPVPGGGGACALVGAIGAALGNMVGSLTVGKKKYAGVEADIINLKSKATALQNELLRLIDADAAVFEPLSAAYKIPKNDPARAAVMESALQEACRVPLDIMRACAKAIDLTEEFAVKGSALAISDAGVSAKFLEAALYGAGYNVFINTKYMADRAYAEKANADAQRLIREYTAKARLTGEYVLNKLKE